MKKSVALILFIAASVILFSCDKENPEQEPSLSSLKKLEGKWISLPKSVYLFDSNEIEEHKLAISVFLNGKDVGTLLLKEEGGNDIVIPYTFVNDTLYATYFGATIECFNFQIKNNNVSCDVLRSTSILYKAKKATMSWSVFGEDKETSLAEFLKKYKDYTFRVSIGSISLETLGIKHFDVVREGYYGKTIYGYEYDTENNRYCYFYIDDKDNIVLTDYLEMYNQEDNVYVYYDYDTLRLYGTIQ